ncbi:MAG: hypothetical protein CMJ78_24790 [Planctomycetaceae bacterium]|nr:hypothetical protein [Planctomycetaceae bacterium]
MDNRSIETRAKTEWVSSDKDGAMERLANRIGIASLLFLLIATAPLCAQDNRRALSGEELFEQIQRIFKQSCYECHGAESQLGGLRLDSKQHANAGANSGVAIVGGDLVTNGIFQRLISDDGNFRMPRDAEPLSADDIETVRQWVLQGSPWPDEPEKAEAAPGVFTRINDAISQHQDYAMQFLALLVIIVAFEIWRSRRTKTSMTADSGSLPKLFQTIRPSHHLIVLLAFVIYFLSASGREQVAELEKSTAELQTKLDRWENPTTESIYGVPPVPFRPNHPPKLAMTYYRGNCERNPKLQNGGNYRTGTFRLNLCNQRGKLIKLGDSVGGDDLCVRVQLDRAPYTSDLLYSNAVMSAIFFTRHYLTPENLENDFVQFRNIDYQDTWSADFPIGKIPDNGTGKLSGLFYLCQGYSAKRTVADRYHFGIKYDLQVEDGLIATGSDLWMGSLFWTQALAVPQRDKVPMHEWFDHRPIPVLKQENTADPSLIGADEYFLQQQREPTPSAN